MTKLLVNFAPWTMSTTNITYACLHLSDWLAPGWLTPLRRCPREPSSMSHILWLINWPSSITDPNIKDLALAFCPNIDFLPFPYQRFTHYQLFVICQLCQRIVWIPEEVRITTKIAIAVHVAWALWKVYSWKGTNKNIHFSEGRTKEVEKSRVYVQKRILLDGSLSRANEEKMWAADWGNLLHVNPQLLSLLFIQEVSFSFGDGAGVI